MDTKLKGDIAEQASILKLLEKGWGVLKPSLIKIQVKSAWFDEKRQNYVVDSRRTKTNRRKMLRALYQEHDFDFALLYIHSLQKFYVMPVEVFISYRSEIHLVETTLRQRKAASAAYQEAWHLIEERAVYLETFIRTSVKFGETSKCGNPEPSLFYEEGVET
jgi:uncharacterized protein YcgL (UPF0745 family)